ADLAERQPAAREHKRERQTHCDVSNRFHPPTRAESIAPSRQIFARPAWNPHRAVRVRPWGAAQKLEGGGDDGSSASSQPACRERPAPCDIQNRSRAHTLVRFCGVAAVREFRLSEIRSRDGELRDAGRGCNSLDRSCHPPPLPANAYARE